MTTIKHINRNYNQLLLSKTNILEEKNKKIFHELNKGRFGSKINLNTGGSFEINFAKFRSKYHDIFLKSQKHNCCPSGANILQLS